MNAPNFENLLRQSLHDSGSEAALPRRELLSILARREVQLRRSRRRIRFGALLGMELHFQGWRHLLIQGMYLLLSFGIIRHTDPKLLLSSPGYTVKLLLCLCAGGYLLSLPYLCRSLRFRMGEIEAAAYFSSIRLLMARLLLVGLGDLGMLGGLFLAVWGLLPPASALMCLLLPFLLYSGAGLFLLGHFPARFLLPVSALICLISLFLPSALLHPGAAPSLPLSILACILPAYFCARQLHYLLYRSPYTQLQTV